MSRQRICFVGWADHVHLERWAGYFAEQGHDVSVISFTGRGSYPSSVRQHVIGLPGRGRRWIEWKLRYLLWRLRPQIVHVHWAHFAVSVRRAWSGPLVVTAWGSDIYRSEAFSDAQRKQLGQALRASDRITCDSEDLARTIRAGFMVAPNRVDVIQWGVDTALFCPQGPDLRSVLELADREVVLSARNFTRLYNQDKVIAAFDALRRERPRAFLLMKNYGGDAQVVSEIEREIAHRGLLSHVRILGSVAYEEMPKLYRTADVTISIPSSDAAPMSLLEAMACGSPTVVCDLPSLREWVTEGETGRLVDPSRPEQSARAMRELLENRAMRRRIVTSARQLVEARASQRVHMARMSSIYSLLAR